MGGVAPAIVHTPRALTERVRWRSWFEPRVRFWWMAGAVFLGVSLYFLIRGGCGWHHENWLLAHGTLIQATIDTVENEGNTNAIKGKMLAPDGQVSGHYTVDGQTYDLYGFLKRRTAFIEIGADVPLHINPADPNDWTSITSRIRLIDEDDFIHGLGVLPFALLLGAVAVWWRQRVLRLWQQGQAVEATVVESRTSAMAPRLRDLRCAPIVEGQQRVQRVFGPARLGAIAPGERLWLLSEPGGKLAVAAAWFE